MREIKFRAWDKTNKHWLLGYETIGGFSLTGECVIFGEFSGLFRPLARLNEIEIMQFTGLKDKNGREIYEGDVVKRNDHVGIVKYEKNAFLIHFTLAERFGIPGEDIEVIGNIYETPELMEGHR